MLTAMPLTDLAIVWGSILIFDAAVFAFTINRMRNTSREWRGSLLNLMLRDGACALGEEVSAGSLIAKLGQARSTLASSSRATLQTSSRI